MDSRRGLIIKRSKNSPDLYLQVAAPCKIIKTFSGQNGVKRGVIFPPKGGGVKRREKNNPHLYLLVGTVINYQNNFGPGIGGGGIIPPWS